MEHPKVQTNEKHLEKASSRTRFAYYFLSILLIINIVVWAGLIIIMISAIFYDADFSNNFKQGIFDIITTVFAGITITLILRTVTLIPRDVVKRKSPFNPAQVRRIRFVALFLLLYGIIDLLLVSNFSGLTTTEGFGYTNTASSSEPATLVNINIGTFIAAVVVYSLSIVFEYGSELQRQSDSIL